MARVSIYVPDELKARMDRIGEAANWSEVVRPAIRFEVASLEHRRGANMTTAIERLRASKEEYVKEMANLGRDAGRAWATDIADYADLVRVARIEEQRLDGGALDTLRSALDPGGNLNEEEFYSSLGLRKGDDNDLLAASFIKGVEEFFEEVKDRL